LPGADSRQAALSFRGKALLYYVVVAPTNETFMKSRFKSNNFIALLIALLLIATGFALAFIHRQSKTIEEAERGTAPVAAITKVLSASSNSPG